MQLNLPVIERLANSQHILIAGAGGGFDVFGGLPLYFTLRNLGKQVHLANYSFSEFAIAKIISEPEILIDNQLIGARGRVKRNFAYFPEGFLAQWFLETRGEEVPIWMFAKTGVVPYIKSYQRLIEHLGIDAIILVDGGVDSLMHGDEERPGTVLEDSITLAAVEPLDVPVKILVCLGFGTEVEEGVAHHHALENIATLAAEGAFWGACALTAAMEVFQLYESAARYVWEQPQHTKSHVHTRVIPSVRGKFGDYHMYPDDPHDRVASLYLSSLMSLYWFFDAKAVARHNLYVDQLQYTVEFLDAFQTLRIVRTALDVRKRRSIPY